MNGFMGNPHSAALKKYLFEILKDRYWKNEKYIERLAASTMVQDDYDGLGSLIVDVFELGFLRAVDQYKDQMAKMGLRVQIVPESKPAAGERIFKDT